MNPWVRMSVEPPEECRVVMLYRLGDLYPIVGWRAATGMQQEVWIIEEGGPEDSEQRSYPYALPGWQPTHWRELPSLPVPDESREP
jgi:hypothetical protein